MLARPLGGGLGSGIKSISFFESRDKAVVVPADVVLRAFERAHGVEDLIRLRAVADEIAEAGDAIELLAPNPAEDRPQRFAVRVNVADDHRPHDVLRERFFGNSRRIRSTISIGDSSSRISIVASHIR